MADDLCPVPAMVFVHPDCHQWECAAGHWFAVRPGTRDPNRCPFAPCESSTLTRVGPGSRGPRKERGAGRV